MNTSEDNKQVILVDMEGTLSDSRHRGIWTPDGAHKWHDLFNDDQPNPSIKQIVENYPADYIITTAKPVSYRRVINHWLKKYMVKQPIHTFMRPDGNFDPSRIVKEEMLSAILPCYDVELAIDDREEICAMFRRYNIPTIHFKNTL